MIKKTNVKHPIQRHIIDLLLSQKYARFRDMRPAKIDTNLYSYHLKLLQRNNLIIKTNQGYTLNQTSATKDNIFDDFQGSGPTVIAMLVLQNADGDLLLYKRPRQPFVDDFTLPSTKVKADDAVIEAAAAWIFKQKLGGSSAAINHAGDCYIRLIKDDQVIASVLAHIFYGEVDELLPSDGYLWVRPHKLSNYSLAPAVETIVSRTFFRDAHFFEQYNETLLQ